MFSDRSCASSTMIVSYRRSSRSWPISVVPVGDGYAIRDGHHRVSVARARGALTIDAQVDVLPG